VLQVVGSLGLGGAERVAVNLANHLPRERFVSHLCVTRTGGPLEQEIAPEVGCLRLKRRRRLEDLSAALHVRRYVRAHAIGILHAHSTSLHLASLANVLDRRSVLVWHDHYGYGEDRPRSPLLYRMASWRVSGIIAVNRTLERWAVEELGRPPERVWYVPNFVAEPRPLNAPVDLPGSAGRRIVCVARMAPQKDILNLVRAMAVVVESLPEAHVFVLGVENDASYGRMVREEIERRGLRERVRLLGPRTDATDVVQTCDIGVLSSASEGLPLALIEYGLCRRPAVATQVGQCADVLAGGRAGILVPPRDPERLAEALIRLLRSPEERARLGALAWEHANRHHSVAAVVGQVAGIYERLLEEEGSSHSASSCRTLIRAR
jgi:glycosyltransferase involved in cell wall biosynthesis